MLKRATIQQKLVNEQTERVTQEAQARVAQAEASAKKALRVCKKGARRSQEVINYKKVLQAKNGRLTSDSDVGQLRATLDGREEACLRAEEDARIYRNKYHLSLVILWAPLNHLVDHTELAVDSCMRVHSSCRSAVLVVVVP